MDRSRFALHVIHQKILPQVVWCGEIRFAFTHLGDFLNEIHQAIVRRQHEGVDQNAGSLALVHFLQSFSNNKWIESERVLVNASVLKRKRRRLAVGDHHDLAHVFALPQQNSLRPGAIPSRVFV